MVSWIKRTALKRRSSKSGALLSPVKGPDLIMLISLLGLFIALGLFVMDRSYAAGTLFGG